MLTSRPTSCRPRTRPASRGRSPPQAAVRQHHPDLDLSACRPRPSQQVAADIDALDEATFQAKIDEWKRANE